MAASNNLTLVRGVDEQPRRLLQVVSQSGGLGDQLARMVAVRESLRLDDSVDIRLFISAYMLPLLNASPDLAPFIENGRLLLFDVSDLPQNLNKLQPGIIMGERSFSPSRLSLVDDGLLTLADSITDINGKKINKDYIEISPPKIDWKTASDEFCRFEAASSGNKIAIVTTGFTSATRSWPTTEIDKYTTWLKENDVVPVFLGASKNTHVDTSLPEINTDGCIDLREKTTLLEALYVMNYSNIIVGVDNGLMHLAACLAFLPPIVGGYTTIDPKYRQLGVLVATVEPDESLDCRFCQSKYNFAFEHDFRVCMYGDIACRTHMTAEKFIEASKGILDAK